MKVNESKIAILRGITASKDGAGFRKWLKPGQIEIWSKDDLRDGGVYKIQMLKKSSGPYLMAYEAKDTDPTHILTFDHFEVEIKALSGTAILSQSEENFLALAKLGKGYLQKGEKIFVFDHHSELVEFGSREDYEVASQIGDIEPPEIAECDLYTEVRMHYARTSGMGSYTRYSVIGPDGKDIPAYRHEGGAIGDAIWRWGDIKDALMICWNGSNSGIQRHSIRYCSPKPTPEQAKWFRQKYEQHRTDGGYVFQHVPEQLKKAMEELEN